MYKIRLPNFEGPFDLLLYFIKRDEINIYDIPIARITEEFLKYIRLMQIFDLELAGEFLVMASSLMYVKTQLLLPRYKDEEGEELEDPRTQLVERLLEYRKFKEASGEISEMAESQRYTYYRNLFDADYKQAAEGIVFTKSNIFDLMKAFNAVLERKKKVITSHEVRIKRITVEEKMSMILSKISRLKRVGFFKLTENNSRSELIVSFLAVLELIKLKKVFIKQSDVFEDITIGLVPNLN